MIVKPFEAGHLKLLQLQDAQAMMEHYLSDEEYASMLETTGQAFSAFVGDEIIASLGVAEQHPGRAIAWGLIGRQARHHFVPLSKAIRRFLDFCPFHRVETAVKTDFAEGHRWARLLGMEREGTMRSFAPDGSDYDLYARVKWIR